LYRNKKHETTYLTTASTILLRFKEER